MAFRDFVAEILEHHQQHSLYEFLKKPSEENKQYIGQILKNHWHSLHTAIQHEERNRILEKLHHLEGCYDVIARTLRDHRAHILSEEIRGLREKIIHNQQAPIDIRRLQDDLLDAVERYHRIPLGLYKKKKMPLPYDLYRGKEDSRNYSAPILKTA